MSDLVWLSRYCISNYVIKGRERERNGMGILALRNVAVQIDGNLQVGRAKHWGGIASHQQTVLNISTSNTVLSV